MWRNKPRFLPPSFSLFKPRVIRILFVKLKNMDYVMTLGSEYKKVGLGWFSLGFNHILTQTGIFMVNLKSFFSSTDLLFLDFSCLRVSKLEITFPVSVQHNIAIIEIQCLKPSLSSSSLSGRVS